MRKTLAPLVMSVVMQTPAASASAEMPGDFYFAAIKRFCAEDMKPDDILKAFAPDAVKAGGIKLTHGMPWYDKQEVVTNLYLYQPIEAVLWWVNPAEGKAIKEFHIKAKINTMPYEDFVKRHGFAKPRETKQNGTLSDLMHEHSYACGKKKVDVILHEAVWQGDAVGKLVEVVLKKS